MLEGIQQGRLWAVRLVSNGLIYHYVENGLPTLFKTRRDAETFRKRIIAIDPEHPIQVEVLEVTIIEKEVAHSSPT